VRSLQREQAQWRAILLMAALAIVITIGQHRARHRGTTSAVEVAAKRIVWPLQSLFVGTGTVLRNLGTTMLWGGKLARENRDLRRQVDQLKAEKVMMIEYYLENMRITTKLGFEQPGMPVGVEAQVIGRSSGLHRRRITIKAGRGRNVEVGNIVVTAAGLVGRVVEAYGNRAEVVLLLDPEHAVAAIVQRSCDEGMIYAAQQAQRGEQMLEFSKLRRGSDIRAGDIVLSSGLGPVYPRKLPIGTVERVARSPVGRAGIVAYVRPFVDFNHLDYVLVLRRSD
jgi:rod shape-determining protein MreC